MERSRLREGSSLYEHICIGKSLHYRSGLQTLLPLTDLWDFFRSCLSNECLHLTAQSSPGFCKESEQVNTVKRQDLHTTEARFLRIYCSDLQNFHKREPSDQKPSLQKCFLWQRGGSPEWILILLREMPGKSRHTYSLQTYIRDKLWEMQKGCMFVGYHGDECSVRA